MTNKIKREFNRLNRKYNNNIDWNYISENEILSEEFIDYFQDKINWNRLVSSRRLSENFILEHTKYINSGLAFMYIQNFEEQKEAYLKFINIAMKEY